MKNKKISHQTIVITGASSGIGLATAMLAARKGAEVVLSSRNAADLEKIVADLKAHGRKAIGVEADVSRYDDVEKLAKMAAETYGKIDTWINNAGTSLYGYLTDTNLEDERKLFDINFWGLRHGCRVALPELEKTQGTLINIGSEASAVGLPLQGIYAATKHAVKAYTDALRIELQEKNIPVAVCLVRPTAIDTPFPLHAKNALQQGEPSLPNPAFHPDLVARAILECAERPQRDVYVGGPSKLNSFISYLLPHVADLMAKRLIKQQIKGTKIPHTETNEGLTHAPQKEGEIRGGHKGRVRKGSLYTQASLHPFLTAALVVAGAGTGFLLSKRKKLMALTKT